jgi:HEAT repeat protein
VTALAQPAPGDAVERLRQDLRAPVRDPGERDRRLSAWRAQPHHLTELGRALVLRDWREEDVDEGLAAVDRRQRAALLQQFEQEVRDVFTRGDPLSQAAVADLLAELGGGDPALGRAFGPELARLLRHPDPRVREAAARALGKVSPETEVAVPELVELLGAASVADRVAAASALAQLLPTRRGKPARYEVVRAGRAVVLAAGRGLRDRYPEVRRPCAAAIAQAAAALGQSIAGPAVSGPGTARESPETYASDEQAEVLPLVLALKDQGPALAAALGDPDAGVRTLARQALEEIANLRWRLFRQAPGSGLQEEPRDPLLEGLSAALLPLTAGLSDPDHRVRLTALDILETLGPAAAPAAPALVWALGDPDRFVRWAAARTLGKLHPQAAGTAVPALARLLGDADLDLRLAAARALERYGPAAQQALPALLQTLAGRDAVEVRLAALGVLEKLGPANAAQSLPVLCAALADPEVRIRLRTAQSLGRLGPQARAAVESLRQAGADPSPEVRQAAGAALLLILQPVTGAER